MNVYPMYGMIGVMIGYVVANHGIRHRWGISKSVCVTVAIGFPIAVLVETFLSLLIGVN